MEDDLKTIKWKTTSKKRGRQSQKKNGRQPQKKLKIRRRPQKREENDLKKI